ncbi:Peptide chain release factor class I/class II domain and Peptide chain release factor domain and Double-stranded RNA-binding domain-containing protein [Strongyloides ratti]|uniref:Peptide chain release factor class I/class II domain and Peptide chain release factor domain and Double-stranded RNA-binding domain-containing protein n=1 Tax=Strongyloides ratti TaxID=34506 RepID=A0A090LJN3_STRRB|nr:Peptide chain release factor class I/class II domain and Peptide chain release factor domain and Double-stranded RNA-binding domain-containing protein [Strongyloides ratti]CEF68338.1 Peptide chain release factor class I/class II domain and Peptide chain release factor domain and Double-stranded RNA-binding domain-containing protein [Strongyloides ratti]
MVFRSSLIFKNYFFKNIPNFVQTSIRNISVFTPIIEKPETTLFLKKVEECFKSVKSGQSKVVFSSSDISYFENILSKHKNYLDKINEIKELSLIINSNDADKDIIEIGKSEILKANEDLDICTDDLAKSIVRKTEIDTLSNCQLEFSCGTGGTEAMMFTMELYNMYMNFCNYMNFTWTPIQFDDVSSASLRSAVVLVSGDLSYATLRFEAGVHRVQRIPLTDKSRIHTSTTSLAILPEPEDHSVIIKSSDCKIESMRASGPGGQNVNKRSSAIRITHLPTNISVHVMDERFQHLNLQTAYKRLAGILLQQKLDSVVDKTSSTRKLQVGTKVRSEKIRTFNFKDDRVTDHRLRKSVGNLREFMKGNEMLEEFTNDLNNLHIMERLESEIYRDDI